MFKFGRYVAKDTPIDVKNPNILSLVFFKQSTLEDIVTECLPYANQSEFQVHYRSIIVRLKNATNELIVTVPTAFFNFKQTVTHSSVNFQTADEATAASAARTSSAGTVSAILQEFPALQNLKAYADYNGFEYSIIESNSGSIHRHPGDFSFSGIDRDKSPDEPGVIYRHLNAVDAVKTDSVIYLPSRGLAKIVTTETRIVNVHESENGILGSYIEVPTVTCILKDTAVEQTIIDTFDSLLGESSGEDINLPYKYVRASGASTKEYALVTEILNQFTQVTTSPDLTNVIGSNIEERKFFSYGKFTHKHKIWHEGKLVDAEWDYVLKKYVPAETSAIPAPPANTGAKLDYVKREWVPIVPEESLIATQHKSNAYLSFNDYDEYGAY